MLPWNGGDYSKQRVGAERLIRYASSGAQRPFARFVGQANCQDILILVVLRE
ncbi:hypothetical protein D3C75_620530 [compost metagenome]